MTDYGLLYESYARFIRDIGGEPLTYERWLSANPNLWCPKTISDTQFDADKEREGDAQ